MSLSLVPGGQLAATFVTHANVQSHQETQNPTCELPSLRPRKQTPCSHYSIWDLYGTEACSSASGSPFQSVFNTFGRSAERH